MHRYLIVVAVIAGSSTLLVASSHPRNQPFGTPLTLETGPDDGFLACAAPLLKPQFRNGKTSDVFNNFTAQPATADVGVVTGHGISGVICTGAGNQCLGDPGMNMGHLNVKAWVSAAQKLSNHFSALRLLGCQVGAGQEGADFLYEMAKAINKPVAAPTSWVWCQGSKVYLDPAAKWQEATPQTRPKPIAKPPAKTAAAQPKTYALSIDGKVVPVAASAVTVHDFQAMALSADGAMRLRAAPSGTAAELLPMIDFANPIRDAGVPAAVVTATIDLDVRLNDRATRKTFKVYNDELVKDTSQDGVYYTTTEAFGRRLVQLRSRNQ